MDNTGIVGATEREISRVCVQIIMSDIIAFGKKRLPTIDWPLGTKKKRKQDM
jgi:hypothetical protein